MLFLLLLAETISGTPAAPWWSPLVNTGAIGGVLVWFMLRNEPRLRAIEAAIDTVSRTLILAVLAMRSCDKGLQDQAQSLLKEVDRRSGTNTP